MINQISSVYNGINRLDFRGYPEIEGAAVYRHIQNQKKEQFNNNYYLENILGIIMPGVYQNGKYRDYLTLMIDIKPIISMIAKTAYTAQYK